MEFDKKLTEDGKGVLFGILLFDSGKKIHLDEEECKEFEAKLAGRRVLEIGTDGLKFTCPDCKDHRLECCEDGAYSSPILNIDEEGDFDYGEIDGSGDVVRFQCLNCGYTLMEDNYPISDNEEVAEWIKENCPQE